LGTFLLPIFLFFSGVRIPIGGWGKPVPVDPRNMKNPRKDNLWVALAGPVSNLILASICALLMRGMLLGLPYLAGQNLEGSYLGSAISIIYAILEISIWINLGLAFFNLIPLHPLDGGKVLEGMLPVKYVEAFNRFATYGILIIFALFYLGGFKLIFIPVRFLAGWLIPS